MTTKPQGPLAADDELQQSWLPMLVIAMGQALMSFNVAALPVSMSGMVESFGVPPTTVGSAIVMYSLFVSGFVMLGAKLGQRFGSRLVFQMVVAMFGIAMVMMVLSPTASVMLTAQALAGAAGAALVPSLVVLIANQYRGKQQAKAVGLLGAARAIAGVLAFLIVGFLSSIFSWRVAFGLLVVHSVLILLLSFKLKTVDKNTSLKIDGVGVVLAATAIILISFGCNNLVRWGAFNVREAAPFDILGLSPAPFMVVVGVVLAGAFLVWSRRREAQGKAPLLAMEVIDSPHERSAVLAMFVIVALEAATNFTVPLYIQIVQGRTPLETAYAMMPFNLTVFFTAFLVVRLYGTFTPRQIAMSAFTIVAAGALWLAFVVRNDWSTAPVLLGLVAFGIGQGALVTVLFNVLVTSSPRELAGDVGSLRGTANNLAAAVGTAMMATVAVGLLSAGVLRGIDKSPILDEQLTSQLNLDSINFLSNERLEARLEETTATPEQVAEAMRVNSESRLRSLKIAFLIMAALSVLAIFPSSRLPNYRPGELPAGKLLGAKVPGSRPQTA